MKRSILFLLSCALFLGGCTKEDLSITNTPDPLLSQPTKARFLSLDSIQTLATQLPQIFSTSPMTRSSRTGVVADLRPLSDFLNSGLTKSASSDAGITENVYIVNYADNGGFAVLSTDTRLETILAYSDDGNITDTMSNPGVKMFLEMIPDYAEYQLRDIIWDSLPDYEKYPPQTETFLRRDYSQVGPFVPVNWGQWNPFNDGLPFKDHPISRCPDSNNGNPPAGCVAIAMLHIMAANSHPASFQVSNGWYTCEWNKWRSYTDGSSFTTGSYDRRAIGALVKEIGSAVEMKYGCSGSSSQTKKADAAFKNRFGFATDGIYSYHIDRVMQDLNNGRPIYVGGFATDNWIGHSDGHDWVIDGYKNVFKVWAVYNNIYDANHNLISQEYAGEKRELETRWVHCNYGWHGTGNGYYYSGVFNTEFPQELDPGSSRPNKDDYRHYRFKLEVIKNIRPK